jgi:hypothetical protein
MRDVECGEDDIDMSRAGIAIAMSALEQPDAFLPTCPMPHAPSHSLYCKTFKKALHGPTSPVYCLAIVRTI